MLYRIEQADALDRVLTSRELARPTRRHRALVLVMATLRVRHHMIQARSARENQTMASVVRTCISERVGENLSHSFDRLQFDDRRPAPSTMPSVATEDPAISQGFGHASDLT